MKSSRSFFRAYLRKLTPGVLLLWLLFAGALGLFALLVHEVLWEQEEAFDQMIFSFLRVHAVSDRLKAVMEGVTWFASAHFLQAAYAALFLFFLWGGNRKRALEVGAIGLGGFLVNYLMKGFFQRPRPEGPLIEPLHNFSFPSGHATSAFIFYGLLAYLVWKMKWPRAARLAAAAFLLLFSLLIGFSRVYLRVHYPSDVLAGFCIGFAWLLLTLSLFERLKKRAGREANDARSAAPNP